MEKSENRLSASRKQEIVKAIQNQQEMGRIRGLYAGILKHFKDEDSYMQFLFEIAYQWNDCAEDLKEFHQQKRESIIQMVGKQIVAFALEAYPDAGLK